MTNADPKNRTPSAKQNLASKFVSTTYIKPSDISRTVKPIPSTGERSPEYNNSYTLPNTTPSGQLVEAV